MTEYNHKEIEKKWQQRWADDGLYKTEDQVSNKENYYLLSELPYPSGDLHVGHWYAFAVPDIFARFKRMQGLNVLYPIGFDAFGLPAENAAIKHNVDPREWTENNIKTMRTQLQAMGNSFDWTREFATCTPEYYHWNQWIFNRFFEKGLVYKKKVPVNWDPVDQTVLANEQVLPDGTAERSGAKVEKKDLEQWMFKITDYAEQLLNNLDTLDWPESIKELQRSWIGKSEGAEIEFEVKDASHKITVFTTRPDTLFGTTYMVLAPEHPLVSELTYENEDEVARYVEETRLKSEIDRTAEGKEKTGVQLKGVFAINPANGNEIPIFIADYVLATYGTGAIMAVPAHDERDFEFAKQFNLPITQVVIPCADDSNNPPQDGFEEVERETVIVFLKDKSTGKYALLDWHGSLEGITTGIMGGLEEGQTPEEAVLAEINEEAAIPNARIIEKLRWITAARYCASHKKQNRCAVAHAFLAEVDDLSQQGVIPEDEAQIHTLVWVDESDVLGKALPEHQRLIWSQFKSETSLTDPGMLMNSGEFDGLSNDEAKRKITKHVGGAVTTTYKMRDWSISRQRYWGTPIPIVYDPEGNAHPISDEHLPWLLPVDVDYKPKGTSPLGSSKELLERTERIFGKGWKPEIDTMDTFMDSSWYFLRYLDSKNDKEFSSKTVQEKWMPIDTYFGGAEHTTVHLLYSRFFQMALHDLDLATCEEPYTRRFNRGLILNEDGTKMSKRAGAVNPDEQVAFVGADAVKMYLAFMGPYGVTDNYPWNIGGVVGIRRFLEKVWGLAGKLGDSPEESLETPLHQTIKKITEDVEVFKFNTAIAQMMIFINGADKAGTVRKEQYETFLKLLAPFAPHMTEELWEKMGHTDSIHLEEWPQYDPEKTTSETVAIAVQIAGKVRGVVETSRGAGEAEVLAAAKKESKLAKYLNFKPKKVIFVPDRVINLIP